MTATNAEAHEPRSAQPALWRKLLSRKDTLPLLITLTAGIVCYGFLVNRGMGLPVLGYNISPAERVMHGELPYRDFLYNYTPGVLWLNALLMKLAGPSVWTVNLGLLLFKLATLIALFYAARILTSSKAALIPVAITLGWIGYKVVFRSYPTQYSMLFVLLGLIFMLNYDRSDKARWLVLCGVVIGVIFLFKQNVGVLVLAAATVAIALREGLAREDGSVSRRVVDATKGALLCWAGCAAALAPALAYLTHKGVLSAMVRHFFSLAGEYGDKKAVALPQLKLVGAVGLGLVVIVLGAIVTLRLAPRAFETFVVIVLMTGAALLLVPGRAQAIKTAATASVSYLPLALIAISLAVVVWQFRSMNRVQWWADCGPVVIAGLFALGAYLEMYPRADYAHLVRVLPPMFLLLSVLIARMLTPLKTLLQKKMPAARRAAFLCAATPLVFLFCAGIKDTWQPRFDSSLRFIEQTPLAIDRARGILVSRKQAAFIENLTSAIEAHSSPDDPIFSFAPRGTAFYFLAARRNPTRFVWWRSVGIGGHDRDVLLKSISDAVPRLVMVSDGFHNQRILDQIDARYRQVAQVSDIRVLERIQ